MQPCAIPGEVNTGSKLGHVQEVDKARIKAHHDPGESVNRELLCDQKIRSWAESGKARCTQ